MLGIERREKRGRGKPRPYRFEAEGKSERGETRSDTVGAFVRGEMRSDTVGTFATWTEPLAGRCVRDDAGGENAAG